MTDNIYSSVSIAYSSICATTATATWYFVLICYRLFRNIYGCLCRRWSWNVWIWVTSTWPRNVFNSFVNIFIIIIASTRVDIDGFVYIFVLLIRGSWQTIVPDSSFSITIVITTCIPVKYINISSFRVIERLMVYYFPATATPLLAIDEFQIGLSIIATPA